MALKSILSKNTKVITEREALIDLIKAWKNCKIIWDDASRQVPKTEKDTAWQYLLKLYRRVNPNADLLHLKNKLGALRDAYKRERKKVLKAKEEGIERWPSLWYYDLLRFLDKPGEDDNTQGQDKHNNILRDRLTLDCQNSPNTSFYDTNTNIVYLKRDTFYESEDEEKSYITVPQDDEEPAAKIQKTTEFPSTSQQVQKASSPSEAMLYAQNLGMQLQELEHEQKIIAEKLISDIIFYARLNKLTVDSSVLIVE